MFLKRNRPGVDFIIVGLGNPGKKYERTRHNVGFWMVDALAQRHNIRVSRARFSALCGEGRIGASRVVLMKPMTYMNLSGSAVLSAAAYYKVDAQHILILCDDVSLNPGVVRIRAEGSAGGHNGLANIIDLLETPAFPRVRIGVGQKPGPHVDLADWVTAMPSSADTKKIKDRTDDILDAVALVTEGNLSLAQSRYNG
jgi:PTH1 family peptidyl-tRNA hydrolase